MRPAPQFDGDPAGRLDVLALRLAERLTRRHIEPALGLEVWPTIERSVAELCEELRPAPPRRRRRPRKAAQR